MEKTAKYRKKGRSFRPKSGSKGWRRGLRPGGIRNRSARPWAASDREGGGSSESSNSPPPLDPQEVRKHLCPTATDAEFRSLWELLLRHRLDPFLGELHWIKYGDAPGRAVVELESLLRAARGKGGFPGYRAGWFDRSGQRLAFPAGAVAGAWCEIPLPGAEPIVTVAIRDWNEPWTPRNIESLRQGAIARALREFAPAETAGLHLEQEEPTRRAPSFPSPPDSLGELRRELGGWKRRGLLLGGERERLEQAFGLGDWPGVRELHREIRRRLRLDPLAS